MASRAKHTDAMMTRTAGMTQGGKGIGVGEGVAITVVSGAVVVD